MTPEALAEQRARRKANGNADTKKYEKTVNGFLMRLYRNMQSRVTGVQAAKYHLYKDKELLSREDFYSWAHASPEFLPMYTIYVESGYNQKLAPTVDRRESCRGYTTDNMRWLTHSENSRLGAISRYGRTKTNTNFSYT